MMVFLLCIIAILLQHFTIAFAADDDKPYKERIEEVKKLHKFMCENDEYKEGNDLRQSENWKKIGKIGDSNSVWKLSYNMVERLFNYCDYLNKCISEFDQKSQKMELDLVHIAVVPKFTDTKNKKDLTLSEAMQKIIKKFDNPLKKQKIFSKLVKKLTINKKQSSEFNIKDDCFKVSAWATLLELSKNHQTKEEALIILKKTHQYLISLCDGKQINLDIELPPIEQIESEKANIDGNSGIDNKNCGPSGSSSIPSTTVGSITSFRSNAVPKPEYAESNDNPYKADIDGDSGITEDSDITSATLSIPTFRSKAVPKPENVAAIDHPHKADIDGDSGITEGSDITSATLSISSNSKNGSNISLHSIAAPKTTIVAPNKDPKKANIEVNNGITKKSEVISATIGIPDNMKNGSTISLNLPSNRNAMPITTIASPNKHPNFKENKKAPATEESTPALPPVKKNAGSSRNNGASRSAGAPNTKPSGSNVKANNSTIYNSDILNYELACDDTSSYEDQPSVGDGSGGGSAQPSNGDGNGSGGGSVQPSNGDGNSSGRGGSTHNSDDGYGSSVGGAIYYSGGGYGSSVGGTTHYSGGGYSSYGNHGGYESNNSSYGGGYSSYGNHGGHQSNNSSYGVSHSHNDSSYGGGSGSADYGGGGGGCDFS